MQAWRGAAGAQRWHQLATWKPGNRWAAPSKSRRTENSSSRHQARRRYLNPRLASPGSFPEACAGRRQNLPELGGSLGVLEVKSCWCAMTHACSSHGGRRALRLVAVRCNAAALCRPGQRQARCGRGRPRHGRGEEAAHGARRGCRAAGRGRARRRRKEARPAGRRRRARAAQARQAGQGRQGRRTGRGCGSRGRARRACCAGRLGAAGRAARGELPGRRRAARVGRRAGRRQGGALR